MVSIIWYVFYLNLYFNMQILFTILLNFQYAIQNRTDYFNNQLKKQTAPL